MGDYYGDTHGQRSVVGYGPKSCKELDTIEVTEHTHTRIDPLRVTCRTRLLGPGHQRGGGLQPSFSE